MWELREYKGIVLITTLSKYFFFNETRLFRWHLIHCENLFLNSEHGLQKDKRIPEENIWKTDAEWKDNIEINLRNVVLGWTLNSSGALQWSVVGYSEFIQSFCSLPYYSSIKSSKASSPQRAI